jgi:hypothetical protein
VTDTRLQFLGDEGEYWIFGFGELVFRQRRCPRKPTRKNPWDRQRVDRTTAQDRVNGGRRRTAVEDERLPTSLSGVGHRVSSIGALEFYELCK